MNPQRAAWLLDNTGRWDELKWAFRSPLYDPPKYLGAQRSHPIDPNGITREEYNSVVTVLNMMGQNHCSFFGALELIAGRK